MDPAIIDPATMDITIIDSAKMDLATIDATTTDNGQWTSKMNQQKWAPQQ